MPKKINQSELVFRRYHKNDFEKLSEINNAFARHMNKEKLKKENFDLDKFYQTERKLLKENSADKDNNYFVCSCKEEFVGFILCNLDDEDVAKGYIQELFVQKSFRRLGIATRLILEATQWIKENKGTEIEINAFTNDKEAIRLYKKVGFTKEKYHLVTLKKKI
jgi:ribosomal protein S18 acetylase RimI-like enzyme